MSYQHLTISERIRIEVLSILGYSTRFIAKFLHRHHSTIARELSRNKIKNEYVSTSAHNKYLKRRKNSSHSSKYNGEGLLDRQPRAFLQQHQEQRL